MITVEPVTESTTPAAAEVLAQAFADDPTMARFVPPTARHRHRRLVAMFLSEMHTCGFDRVDTAVRSDTGELVGAGVWSGPGRPIPRALALRWSLVTVRALGWRGLQVSRRYEVAGRLHHPEGPHWHLLDLGASPTARGSGVGSALLEHRLAVIDAERLPARLEATTEGSRRLYERYGFEPVGTLPADVGGAYAMVRPARR